MTKPFTLSHSPAERHNTQNSRPPFGRTAVGASGRIRTGDLLITKSGQGPKSADFRRFRGLSAHYQIVSSRLVSAVSTRSFPRVGHGVGQGGFRGFTKTVKICTGVTEEYGKNIIENQKISDFCGSFQVMPSTVFHWIQSFVCVKSSVVSSIIYQSLIQRTYQAMDRLFTVQILHNFHNIFCAATKFFFSQEAEFFGNLFK